jgi:CRP-like cAMP-binding protein
MPRIVQAAAKNRLLEALPAAVRTRLLARAERVPLAWGSVLVASNERIRWVYFPTAGAVSLISPVTGHAGLEVARVGDEGMLGLTMVLGGTSTPERALVQASGTAWRLEAGMFRREVARSPPLRRVLDRYIELRLREFGLMAVCAHFHELDARFARWLLIAGDQLHRDDFYMTQESLSAVLGVRRASVNRVASSLQQRKLIRYRRGEITLLDRGGLESAACECYAVLKANYAARLG